jgi:E3 ubiquitin-protein ligase UBR4
MEFNLRRGTPSIRHEVRKLICLLTKDNREATNHLNKLLSDKIGMALKGHSSYPDLVESVRHEMTLLGVTVQKDDSCWEQRLRCVLKIFLLATNEGKNSPTVMECITLPCLKILHSLMRSPPASAAVKKDTSKNPDMVIVPYEGTSLQVDKWMSEMDGQTYEDWKKRALRYVAKNPPAASVSEAVNKKSEARSMFLQEKYFKKWHSKTLRRDVTTCLNMSSASWLKRVLFNPSSRMAREVACQMVESFCSKDFQRKKQIVQMLTTFLDELSEAGEASAEFVCLYQRLITTDQWKYYLAIKGTLAKLASLITCEIEQLDVLEHQSLSSDLAQGFALKTLTDIFASFVAKEPIKRVFKGRLVSTVLHGYLSLRRLVVQRTKLVDQTQEKLLELLEDMTTGTEEETKNFMAVCVQTIDRYPLDDQLTPVFIFERLCNLIYPEETDTGEFLMTLEKDPQQEDFLQGRMLGNPYSSNDPDLGPLMREIKNKICTDCELVALLEDDNGMELLVNNKIISLDLPVKDVYQKVWMPFAQENEPMRIIYR